MNIKLIAERINKNYDSDNSVSRSKSCNKDYFSYRHIDEQLDKERSKINNKRFLIEKTRYDNVDTNNEVREIKNPELEKVSKIQSLETLRSERDKNPKSKLNSNKKNYDTSNENYNYLRYGENFSARENSGTEFNSDRIHKKLKNLKNTFNNNNNNINSKTLHEENYKLNKNLSYDSNSEYNEINNYNNFNNEKDSAVNLFTNLSTENYTNNNNNLNSNNYNEFFEEYKKLKSKYKKLKGLYRSEIDACAHWKSSYFNLLRSSLTFDDTIKTLIEENRIHQEYIINLEKKNQKILSTCTNITNDFHNNLFFNLNNLNSLSLNSNSNNNNINNNNFNSESLSKLISKNFNELLNDYKKQLDVLAEEKDTLFSNLSLARHQHLQMTLKMEEIQNRIFNLEKLRSDDLVFLDNKNKNKN